MTASVNRYVFVVIFQRFAIFCELNGIRIEDPNRDILTAKFNRTISWGDLLFERCFSVVAYGHPHVGSLEWANSDVILFA